MWAAARRLVEEYASSLDVDLEFQSFADEIESLSHEYGPPHGCFLLAEDGDEFVGCGAIRWLEPHVCEMKRLYVVPTHRGSGAGRQLAIQLIAEADRLGYERMRLDTLPSMGRAQALYVALGFHETPAYRYNPVAGTRFLELTIADSPVLRNGA